MLRQVSHLVRSTATVYGISQRHIKLRNSGSKSILRGSPRSSEGVGVPGPEGRRSQQDEGLPFSRPRTVASSAVAQLLGLAKRVSDNILYN